LRIKIKTIFVLLPALTLTLSIAGVGRAAGNAGKLNVNFECHCTDSVGLKFCAEFKQQIRKSAAYKLVDNTNGYGLGVHFSCVDMWKGLVDRLSGHMSAVSVAFTIYADTLPGEMLEDNLVIRVGADSVGDESRQIVSVLGQLVTANASTLDRLNAASENTGTSPGSAETSGASTGSAETPQPSPEASAVQPSGDSSAPPPPF
jgi:hypothetical protein